MCIRDRFGSRATVLYEAKVGDITVPVVTEYRDRTTLAIFCGFGLSHDTAEAAARAISFALSESAAPSPVVGSCSEGVLWNHNELGYLIVVNTSDQPGYADINVGRLSLWDCLKQKALPRDQTRVILEPHSFGFYRMFMRRSKFIDVLGASALRKVTDGAGRADIDLLAGRKTVLVLRSSPKEIRVDGKYCTITQEIRNGAYHVTLQQCPPGEHTILLRW
ncbi:MAG: hypothetical protein N3B12_02870, partial [Armatimonadetes bacterium]|nr:hypothetical protein [Armatimonadota bacterium]